MSPDREKTLRRRALEQETSKDRRPHYDPYYSNYYSHSYHQSMGSPEVFTMERLKNSTLHPVPTEEKISESQLVIQRSQALQSPSKVDSPLKAITHEGGKDVPTNL